ncbi:neuropeptides capa receptor [Biomphalaria glabrata]|nr:neuropeptides capa receptor-like [Biomphalaria glabrata]
MNITNSSSTATATSLYIFFIDSSVMNYVVTINALICSELIGLLGIVANIINIFNFKRQGFQDGVNVTLFSLALCDTGALLAQQLSNILISPWVGEYDLFMLKSHLFVLTFYVNGYFIRVSGVLTSFLTFERCLCVVWPLKVKRVLTTRTAFVVNTVTASVFILYLFPPFSVTTIDWILVPTPNKSILALQFKSNRHSVMTIYYFIADQFVPYATILLLILCTITIVTKLRSKLKWRQSTSSAGGGASGSVTNKEGKVVTMLINISVIFIICLLPQSTLNTAMGFVPGLKVDGVYFNIFKLCYSFTSLLETVNCSVSILVYYKMSTKYRQEFWTLFHPLTYFKNLSLRFF